MYDTEDGELRRRGMILRLRQIGDECLLTWKGPGVSGPHKSREELETAIDSLDAMDRILRQLGYGPAFRYEKYRTEFAAPGADGIVTLDETPIGDFLELEGTGEWIDRTAERLGYSRQNFILESYGRLYLADCAHRGVEPADMVFASGLEEHG